MTSPSDATSDPVPSGESETLEERLRTRAEATVGSYGLARRSLLWEAADELARLRSEVARLTAEREEAGRCELCGGLGYVPTRTPDESGEMYDDCRGCDGSGERPTGAQMEELRDRLDARDCDVQIACEASEHHRAEAARYREALEEAEHDLSWMALAVEGHRNQQRAMRTLNRVRRSLTTEGGDRAEE